MIASVTLLFALAALGCLPLALGVVPPNGWYGFRTPRSVTDERVWYPVNRQLGIDFMLACAATAILFPLVGPLGNNALLAAVFGPMAIAVFHALWWASAFVAELDAESAAQAEANPEAETTPTSAPQKKPTRDRDLES
jgi:uncharacterized membrane protein